MKCAPGQFRRPGVCRDRSSSRAIPLRLGLVPTTTRAAHQRQPRWSPAVTTPAQHQADGVDLRLDPSSH